MLGASANKPRGGNVKRLARGAGGRRASSAPRLRKTVQLDTGAETAGASDVPQRHEIAIQTDGQMGRLTLDLNVHHHYHYAEQQPQQQHYPGRGGHRGGYGKQNTHYTAPRH